MRQKNKISKNKRNFIKKAAVGSLAAAALSTFPTPSFAQRKRQFNLISSWPRNMPGIWESVERISSKIKSLTNNRIDFNIRGYGEYSSKKDYFKEVSKGSIDVYHTASLYWTKHSPLFHFFTMFPFGLTTHEMNAWIYHGGGLELWHELEDQYNIISFPCGNTGAQMGGWFQNELTSLSDLKDLKIRAAGYARELYYALGADPVFLNSEDIKKSFYNKTIQAAEFIGPWLDYEYGLHKQAKYYYYPAFQEPTALLNFTLNRKLWKKLSTEDQKIISSVLMAENIYAPSKFLTKNALYLDKIKQENIQIKPFPSEILKAAYKVTNDFFFSLNLDKSDLGKRIMNSYLNTKDNMISWSSHSREAFLNLRMF